MNIDLRTVTIEPLRPAYDHLVQRFGNKPATRYQEGSYDLQAVENLHYRPTWDPEQLLYDPKLSKVRMRDWYAIRDPRQFYYSTYTLTRARQQETAEANFAFVEEQGLASLIAPELRRQVIDLMIPLRHVAWASNQNNTLICGYGYGTTLTQPCMFQAIDQLGIAQYLSRLGLLLGGVETLSEAKQQWLEAPAWQPTRRIAEDLMALRDPVEVFVAQNLVLDGLLYPLVYARLCNDLFAVRGASCIPMLTQFMSEWSDETRKWVDAVIRTLATESIDNRTAIEHWISLWTPRVTQALIPVIELAAEADSASLVEEQRAQFSQRLTKIGMTS
jgi:phenol hydroxylase P1 protein